MKSFWRCPWTWLILLLAVGLRLLGLAHDLPWHADWDEYHYYRNLYYMGTHHGEPLSQLNPPLATYVWGAALVPVGALGMALGLLEFPRGLLDAYTVNPTLIYLVGKGLSVFFGVWTVLLLGRLAERLYGARARIPAMLILAADSHHVLACQNAISAPMGLWACLLALGAILEYPGSPRPGRAVLKAGLFCGLAAATKFNGGLIVLVLVGFILQEERAGLWGKRVLTAAGASLAAFVLLDPWAVLKPVEFLGWLKKQSQWTGPGVFGTTDVLDFWPRALAWSTAYPMAIRILAPVLLVWALLRLRRERILAGFIVVYVLAIVSTSYPQSRYLFPVTLGLCLLAGAAAARLHERGGWGRLAPVALFLALIPAMVFTTWRGILKTRPSTYQQAASWILENLPEGTGIISDDPPFVRRLPSAGYDTFENGAHADLLRAWKQQQGGKLYRVPVDLFREGGPFVVDLEVYRQRGIRYFVISGVGDARTVLPGRQRMLKEAVCVAHFTPLRDPRPGERLSRMPWDVPGFFNRLSDIRRMSCWGTEIWIYRWPGEP